MPIFRRTKKIEFNNFNNFKRSRNNLARRTKETKRKNKENKTYSIDEFIKYHKPIPMLKNLIIKLNIPPTYVEFFTDNGKSDNANPSKGLTITSNAGTISNNRNKKGTNNKVKSEVKNKLNNTSKRFKIGVLQIYPGKKAFKYLRVIGHVNLVIIDTQKNIYFIMNQKRKELCYQLKENLDIKWVKMKLLLD
jgi:hypothetical protein